MKSKLITAVVLSGIAMLITDCTDNKTEEETRASTANAVPSAASLMVRGAYLGKRLRYCEGQLQE